MHLNFWDILIIIAVAAMIGLAIWLNLRKKKKGSSCCGDIAPSERSDSARDKNKSHYPFGTELVIEGMICENCAKKVENALNSLDGVYAKVDLSSSRARILTKAPADEKALISAVARAGYTARQ